MPLQPTFTTADLAHYPVSIQQSLAAIWGPFPAPAVVATRAPVILKFPDPCAEAQPGEGLHSIPAVSADRRRAA